MSSTNRSRAAAGRLAAICACALALALGCATAGRAADPGLSPDFWYAGTRLAFDRPQTRSGALAVASDDFGLGRFLTKLDAYLGYQPGQNVVVVTAADRRTVVFTIGDPHYTVAGVSLVAPFAPYVDGNAVYLPFLELARALYVDPVEDGKTTVLQPQIAALDVRTENRVTVVTLRGGSPLQFKRLSEPGDPNVSLAFMGIASTLERERTIDGAGLHGVSISTGGTPRNPTTVVNFHAPPDGAHALAPAESPNALALAFAPSGVVLGGTPLPVAGHATVATIPLAPAPGPSAFATPPSGPFRGGYVPAQHAAPTAQTLAPAALTALDPQPLVNAYKLRLALGGDVTYEWHRLPDDRWYVDLKPATLAIPPIDETLGEGPVASLRVKGFVGPLDHLPTVRVALTLTSPRAVTLVPAGDGLTLSVERYDDASNARTAQGELTGGRLVAAVPLPPPPVSPGVPSPDASAGPDAGTWKFAPPLPNSGSKTIVIDPGHGGSDAGAAHNGLTEKDLNLDVSKRLAAVLTARGWQVKLTRDTDVDVFAPNDSAHDELQARCDVANNAGARMFVSMHTNSFTSSSLNGTTTYYYKADSSQLAQAIHARFVASLPTKDDGVRKENFYVIHHAAMPAVLVEMAFLSNSGDADYLHSPAFLQKIAVAVADGIGDYAAAPKPLSATSTDSDGS